METICQACGYQRKPTDQAPDWECPSCGKAYVKTAHASPSPLVIYPDSPSAEADNRLHEAVYRREPKETAKNKYGILIGSFLGLFLVFGIPILTNPSSASAILLHGDSGFIALLLIALMVAAGIIKHVSARVDSNDRKSVFVFYAASLGLMIAVLFSGFAIFLHNKTGAETGIQRHGLRAMADVVRIYDGACGRRSCSINVEYTFTPSAGTNFASSSIHGYADLGNRPDDPYVTYARTNKQVPIAYEVDHPEISTLNFNDDVFRLAPGERYRGEVALLGKIFLGLWALFLAAIGLVLWLSSGKKLNAD